MRRVVVTGAAGFIGSNLVKSLLHEGYSVLALDNLSAGTRENLPEGAEFQKIDICDSGLEIYLEGAQAIFHMAAKNCLPECAANPVETARINVAGTANVAQAAVNVKIPHLIYSDTSAEYEGVLDFPSKIDTIAPLSVYASSKRGGALLCEAFTRLYPIRVSTVRYFNVYGPAQDWRRVIPPVMSAFTLKLLAGQRPFIYGTGEKRRDFIHVDDVNAFHLKLLREKELWGGVYNLGSGEDFAVLDIFKKIQRTVGSQLEPEFKDELPAEAFRTLADLTETLTTGWRPKISIDEGIRSFVVYTRDRLRLENTP